MSATVKQAYDAGDDVLLVEGYVEGVEDADGEPVLVQARGWVSSMERHFDEAAYYDEGEAHPEWTEENAEGEASPRDMTGHRREDATPRAMTAKERLEYCRGLLLDQHSPVEVRQPTPLDIGDS